MVNQKKNFSNLKLFMYTEKKYEDLYNITKREYIIIVKILGNSLISSNRIVPSS